MNVVIRKATVNDKDFIIKAIIEATKSGTDILSYCTIFNISESDLVSLLSNILDEDIDGQELSISSYLIADINGERAATFGGWVELQNGMRSDIIVSNLLMHFLDRDLIFKAAPVLKLIEQTNIQRDPNTIQLEIAYVNEELLYRLLSENTFTVKELRELNLIGKLIDEHIRLKTAENEVADKVQTLLFQSNYRMIKALHKAGFTVAKEQKCNDSAILNYLPSDTKILMERKLNA